MRPPVWILLFLTLGCSAKKRKHTADTARYTVGAPGGAWQPQTPGSADQSWFHAPRASAIYTSANCGDRYEDGRLEDLSTHLTFGIASGEPLREEHTHLDSREALIRVYDGQLDGIAVRLGAVVTKKHDCLYDLLYIAPPVHFDAGWSDFVHVIEGFAVTQ